MHMHPKVMEREFFEQPETGSRFSIQKEMDWVGFEPTT
jgi:hypothetical protein